MDDPGFLPGFIGVGLDISIRQILYHINMALRCNTELASLKDLVISIQPILAQIQQYRLELSTKKGNSTSQSNNTAVAVNDWLKKLDGPLQQASEVVMHCTEPRCDIITRYRTSKKITRLILDIHKHMKLLPLIQLAQTQELLLGQWMQRESLQDSASSSATNSVQVPTAGFFIDETLIVGQEEAYAKLEKFVMAEEKQSLFRIGVVGKGGSGKTLLLKRVFNSQQVRHLFVDGLLLWLTVSRTPSFTTLRNELCSQITMRTKADLDINASQDDIKIWLNERLQTSRFALFLDDVWDDGAKLLEELALLHLNEESISKVIVSSRNRRALLEMGVSETSIITMKDLTEDKSWQLFANHAFMYNNGYLPANIDEKTAKLVCANCGGLPLAIKVVGRVMAGITHPNEWDLAVRRLPNVHSRSHQSSIYDSLRLSYDALGSCFDVNLQLCFLYLGAFLEDQIVVVTREVVQFWIGEGLLARKKFPDQLGYDEPFEIVRTYVNILADRCLIEPTMRDADGCIVSFRMHDVVRDLAIQIAEREENCYFRAGRGLTALIQNECSGRTRISLTDNKLSSFPRSLKVQEIRSLLMARNTNFKEFPGKLMRRMTSLKILDLSDTSIKSLPESLGYLKQLVCLRLVGLPIKRLPTSLTNLVRLEILDLMKSGVTELPADLHKLTSLRCLHLRTCLHLQGLPLKISLVTSLQYLTIDRCTRLFQRGENNKCKKLASINNLCSLTQLKILFIQNDGETIREGTFGSMTQMEAMELTLTRMASLPHDIVNMSNLRRLRLQCAHLVQMDFEFWQLQNLTCLTLFRCEMLEDLPDLDKIRNLKQLEIIHCPKIKKFPTEFGENGAFSKLEIFSLAWLDMLEELPAMKKDTETMPSLQIFTIMECEALRLLPENYLYFKNLRRIRIYGCQMILENLTRREKTHSTVEMVTISSTDTKEFVRKYLQARHRMESWCYGEFWSNDFFLFLRNIIP
jgi:Leucine-rich repeat (LRR) protein